MAHLSSDPSVFRRRYRDALAAWVAERISPHMLHDYRQMLAESNTRLQNALDELHTEEIRVRRLVSDRLHGALQNRMVMISAGIDGVARSLRESGDIAHAAELESLATQLDTLREKEVRDLAHTLFPAGIEFGAVRAIQAMVYRLPPQVATSITIGPSLAAHIASEIPIMPLAERMVMVTAVEEAITNALKHGKATALNIELELLPIEGAYGTTAGDDGAGIPLDELSTRIIKADPNSPLAALEQGLLDSTSAPPPKHMFYVTVTDNGRGLDESSGVLGLGTDNYRRATGVVTKISGLQRHADRFQMRGGSLKVTSPGVGEGTKVELALPIHARP